MKQLFWRLSVLSSIATMALATPALAFHQPNHKNPGGVNTRVNAAVAVSTTVSSTTSTPRRPVIDLVCMQTAVAKRETAMITAFDKFSAAKKLAFEKRKTALVDAWKIENRNERRAALRTAWNNFRTDSKTARETFHKERRAAWAQFKTDRKACGPNAHADEPASEGDDAQI